MDLILGLFIAVGAGVGLILGVRERRNLSESVTAWFPWSIVLTASLFGSGAVMIYGAVRERDVELARSALLVLMLIATLMMLIKQRTAR